MRILLLTQSFYPDVPAVGQYFTDLASDLVKRGHVVTVMTSRRGYENKSIVYPLKDVYKEVRVIRVRSTFFGKKSFSRRILDALSLYCNLMLKLLFSSKYDVVIASTFPPFIAILGSIFCKLRGGKFIYWAMDLNPEQAIVAGLLRKDALITQILEYVSSFAFRHSDLVITLDTFMAQRIEKKVAAKKLKILPLWAHEDTLKNISPAENPFRKRYQLDNKFVIMYSGNHSICHPLDTVLNAALQLSSREEFLFLFIGGGTRVQEVGDFKEQHQLSNIMQLPAQERAELSHSLSAGDLHLVVMGNDYVGIVHPCKIYGIFSIGRPFILIGPKKSHIGKIIEENQIGAQVEHGDPDKLAEQILAVYQMSDADKKMLEQQSKSLRQKFSHKTLSAQLIKWIEGS